MGLLNFFKKRRAPSSTPAPSKSTDVPSLDTRETEQIPSPAAQPIPESKKKFYQPDDYYSVEKFAGTPFASKVITFEERKKTSYPSRNGLYPAEILLLEYCKFGTYPNPKNGYPGFWWFEYGIRNVDAVLKSLESRGFIAMASAKADLPRLTIPKLKEILSAESLDTKGRKSDLVNRILESVSEEKLQSYIPVRRYDVTELGQQEIRENEYVKYIHSRKHSEVSVWDVNILLHKNPNADWRESMWSEYEKLLQKYAAEEQDGLYRNVKLQMYYYLKDRLEYEKAYSYLAQVMFLDMNQKELARFWPDVVAPKLIKDFSILNKRFGFDETTMIIKLRDVFSTLQEPRRNFSDEETASIIAAYAFGHSESAQPLFDRILSQ